MIEMKYGRLSLRQTEIVCTGTVKGLGEEEGRPGAFPQGPQGEGQDQVGQEGEEGDDQGEPNP